MEKPDNIAMDLNECFTIEISAGQEAVRCLYSVFQRGFLFPCQVETSIEDLLLRQLGLKPEFIEKKVNTIFLDGTCVDDISSAILKEGSIVALSSALPGLAGATLRRGGHYACLRDSITHIEKDTPDIRRDGHVTVKLFNLLMEELGRIFIEKGIVLEQLDAEDLLKQGHKGLWKHVERVMVGDKPLSLEKITEEHSFTEKNHIMVRIIMNSKTGMEDPPSAREK